MGFLKARAERQMADQVFNLKFTSKQLSKASKKSEKEEKAEKLRVKAAIEKGNIDIAKVYAQNAIRKKNEALNYLRLASRLDAVSSRLDTQVKMNQVNASMVGIVKSLDVALAGNNLEKMAETMDKFETQFETLDVQTGVVENAMNNQAALSTPEEDVNELMQQVADEHGLEVSLGLPGAANAPIRAPAQGQANDDLSSRIAELRRG
jgi:charged multivesicular body protein 1